MILVLYAVFLVATNQKVTVFEDEAAGIIAAGSNAPLETISLFLSGRGNAEHPPLYDLARRGLRLALSLPLCAVANSWLQGVLVHVTVTALALGMAGQTAWLGMRSRSARQEL